MDDFSDLGRGGAVSAKTAKINRDSRPELRGPSCTSKPTAFSGKARIDATQCCECSAKSATRYENIEKCTSSYSDTVKLSVLSRS